MRRRFLYCYHRAGVLWYLVTDFCDRLRLSLAGKGHSLVDGGTGQTDPPAEFGYVKVIVIVVLLYLWYSYANQGDSQKSA